VKGIMKLQSILSVSLVLLLATGAPPVQAGELGAVERDLFAPAPAETPPRVDLGTVDPAVMLQDVSSGSQWEGGGVADSAAPRRWWALLASAAVPGLGETLTGRYVRGGVLIAADVAVWTVWFDKNAEGDDLEEDYRAFALEHWSEERWKASVGGDPDSGIDENFRLWAEDVGATDAETFLDIPLWVSREDDEREWFENLGKWDVFAWGWREFWDPAWNEENNFDVTRGGAYRPQPDDPGTWFESDDPFATPLRRRYQAMRNESNDAFDTRDTLTNVALLTRVFSLLQMAYLEGFIGNRYDRAVPASEGPVSHGPSVRPFGVSGAGLAWKVTY
jgi:hypothetical protein